MKGSLGQFLRFVVVGVLSNAVLYVAYLALTAWGVGAKTAMTIMYTTGVVQTFFFNKSWTFSFEGGSKGPFIRYCLSYAIGYVVNLATLHLFVDRLGYPHQLVQAVALVEVALLLFALHKFWVFRVRAPSGAATVRPDA